MFHFHKWSDWVITERGKVAELNHKTAIIGNYLIQNRYCHACGKTQINRQSTVYLGSRNYRLIPESIKEVPKHDPANSTKASR